MKNILDILKDGRIQFAVLIGTAVIINIILLLLLRDTIIRVLMFSLLILFVVLVFSFYFIVLHRGFFNIIDKCNLNDRATHFISVILTVFVVMMLIVPHLALYPIMVKPIAHVQANKNQEDLEDIVYDLTEYSTNDEGRVLAILEWFGYGSGNMYNAYYLEHKTGATIVPILPSVRTGVSLITKEPYIGIRSYSDDDAEWILTTRYGHCGEYALMFREMAHIADINVRKVSCYGENHEWNEVYIDSQWIVIDATRAGIAQDGGFNVSKDFMENKVKSGNVSYVTARYMNGTRVDVTSTYTNTTNVTVLVQDMDGRPIPDIDINIFSHNRGGARNIRMQNLKSNITGMCTFSVGGGVYTVKATDKKFIPLFGKTKITAYEQIDNNEVTLTVEREFTKNPNWITYLMLIVAAILVLLLLVLYVYKKYKG
ncbi:MAG: transglutaminase-like domain-containing protein [Candidatus Thermoplasmatota archaeon]|nr:transglutaminase-like domain-containing protein [Candidatus Thermoplasmatota archaeon]MDD5778652.1 transglutaminase-like domain-containing protein [Candidatus Thermoplasmatota archaeon]